MKNVLFPTLVLLLLLGETPVLARDSRVIGSTSARLDRTGAVSPPVSQAADVRVATQPVTVTARGKGLWLASLAYDIPIIHVDEATVYADPLYGYQLAIPGGWYRYRSTMSPSIEALSRTEIVISRWLTVTSWRPGPAGVMESGSTRIACSTTTTQYRAFDRPVVYGDLCRSEHRALREVR